MSRVARFHVIPLSRQRRPQNSFFRRLSMALALSLAALLGLATLSVSARRNSQSPDSEAAANLASTDTSKTPRIEFVPGEILVRYRSDAEAKREEAIATRLRKNGREISINVERFDGSSLVEGLRQARVRPEDTLDAIVALKSQPNVLYAEPNYIWRKKATPNDAHYGDLWALKNTGQQGSNDYAQAIQPGIVGEDIDAESAWNITTGNKSVVVAVIDQGVDVNHADLKDNIWVNPGEVAGDGIDNDGNGFIDDVNGWDFTTCNASSGAICGDGTVYDGSPLNGNVDSHGTHVAGTIGARGNNGAGVVGVNWQVSIMAIKVLGANGGPTSNIIRGYNYVRTMKLRGINVRVTNNSYGGPDFSEAAFDAISALNQAGILVVVAAGNDAQDNFNYPDFPSNYDLPNVLAVAATDRFGQLAAFSNFGARAVSMGAPGRGILSTTPHNFPNPQYTDPDGSTYSFFSGTSMATPQVAGAAALALSVNPHLSVQNLRGVLAYSGELLPSLQGVTTTGRRLNAYETIKSVQENDVTAPALAANLQQTAQNVRIITLQWIAPGDDGNAGTASDYDFFFVSPAGKRLLLPSTLLPATAGTTQSATVSLPYLNFSGTVELRTHDNAGNYSTASLPVSVPQNAVSDPYVVTQGAPEGLSTGGTSLGVNADDAFKDNQPLPFSFPFYGVNRTTINVSTNGALYFSKIPRNDEGNGLDAGSSVLALQGQTMIAGLWDDLRTDRTGGNIFVVQPDPTRVIYRWEGVTYNTSLSNSARGEQPINFEIELRSNGTIIFRYGAGQSAPINTRLFPIVGISGGEPDPYVVASHTSDNSLINLTNANTVTFTPRSSATCTYSISPTSQNFVAGAATSSVNVTAGSGCAWTAVSNNPSFITVTSGASGTGNGTVGFSVAANTGVARNGTLTIAGQTFTVSQDVSPPNLQLSQSSYNIAEGTGSLNVIVNRSGDPAVALTVNYTTSDSAAYLQDCNVINNQATSRCDYVAVVGALHFATGETSKTISIPIVDDTYAEGSESFFISLSNPVGGGSTLGAIRSATITVSDNGNEGTGQPNPIDNPTFFVREHYIDFLSREPDPASSGWLTQLSGCGAGDQSCRLSVSQGIYSSPEFKDRGYFIYKFFSVGLGRKPSYDEFNVDRARVSGFQTDAELEQSKKDFIADFMSRSEFANAHNGLSYNEYVAKLFTTAGVTQITVAGLGVKTVAEMQALGRSRGQVLRDIAESAEVSAKYESESTVVMHYFGYLRRDPDGEYQKWITTLTVTGDSRRVTEGFINSTEYRARFGQ